MRPVDRDRPRVLALLWRLLVPGATLLAIASLISSPALAAFVGHPVEVHPVAQGRHGGETEPVRTAKAASAADRAPGAFADGTPDAFKPHVYTLDGAPIYDLSGLGEQDFSAPGVGQFSGRVIDIGGRLVVIRSGASEAEVRDTMSFLGQKIASPISIVSMLDPRADAAVIRRARDAWGDRSSFLEGTISRARLDALFEQRGYERIVLFGHIEVSGTANAGRSGRFVAYAPDGSATSIAIADVLEIARVHNVEPIIIGCESFAAGAPAGVLRPIDGAEIPAILRAIRGARFRAELLAAIASRDRPVFIDPTSFARSLAEHFVAVVVLGDARPSVIIQPGSPAPVAATQMGFVDSLAFYTEWIVERFLIFVVALQLVAVLLIKPFDHIFTWITVTTGRCVGMKRGLAFLRGLGLDLMSEPMPFINGLIIGGLFFAPVMAGAARATGERSLLSAALLFASPLLLAVQALGWLAERQIKARNR